MTCLKCGKKTDGSNVFCTGCLSGMEQHPVKPGTAVYIPYRPEQTERKQTRAVKEKSPEEQIASLHKLVRILITCTAALAAALALSVGVLAYALVDEVPQETEPRKTPTRRNYTTSAPQNVD